LKILLILAAIGVVVGGSVVYYVFNKPHRDIQGEAPAFTLNAAEFYSEFSMDEEAGNVKFGNQVIQVTGPIADISLNGAEATITLNDDMEGISCTLDSMAVANNKSKIEALTVGNELTLKGKCDGFDMIMGVVLTKCFFIEEE
ncbi:MAG: OB-fold protein, partial [Bacteroidia bacterium]